MAVINGATTALTKRWYLDNINGERLMKELTFSNDAAGALSLFTVTGDVSVEVVAVCKTNVASVAAANVRLGVVGYDNAMIVDTLAENLDAGELWNDQSPTDEIQARDRRRNYDIMGGNDIILTLDAQVDSGAVTFYCYWVPLSIGAKVEVA